MEFKVGARVESLYYANKGDKGTIISTNHRKGPKEAPGWCHKVKWDIKRKSKAQIYHEKFLRVITPLEELL